MRINVSPQTPLKQLKEDFSKQFDGLKIEFFKHAHKADQGSPKSDLFDGDGTVGDLSGKLAEVEMHLSADLTVEQLETRFEQDLGLHVQVFRKMRNAWIETTATDHYTLEQQMNLSAESRS